MESMESQIERAFTYHAPKEGQPAIYTKLRDKARALALHMNLVVPNSREKPLAITKLEEAVMWANAGIARHS